MVAKQSKQHNKTSEQQIGSESVYESTPGQTPGQTDSRAREHAAVWVEIDKLHEWDNNPRKNEKAVEKVAKSIQSFGFATPIVARMNGEIIAGHTRWKAAKKLKLERVPVRFMNLDPAQAHMLAIADNRTAEEATWDNEILSATLQMLESENQDLSDLGFNEDELKKLLGQAEEADDESGKLTDSFTVIIECVSEMEQISVIDWAQKQGLNVKAIV